MGTMAVCDAKGNAILGERPSKEILMRIGIVGSEGAKFTPEGEEKARDIIVDLLMGPEGLGGNTLVSGHCHLGGIDIWAEEAADFGWCFSIDKLIFPPATLKWEGGYKQRNLQIAHNSDIVYCITIDKFPLDYKGMKFPYCYHCKTDTHIKSGGCWTMKEAIKMGKKGQVIVVNNF